LRKRWREGVKTERTLLETLGWLRSYHRKAPFLFFNGNTFAEIARTLIDAFFAEFPHARRRQAASLAAHYVAGVLDGKFIVSAIASLAEKGDLKPGDRIKTLKGSVTGKIVRVLSDGRVVWRADSGAELIALPESLLKVEKKDKATPCITTASQHAMKKLPGEGFKHAWSPLIKMDEAVKAKISALLSKRTNLSI
jgi:hypothetical protein